LFTEDVIYRSKAIAVAEDGNHLDLSSFLSEVEGTFFYLPDEASQVDSQEEPTQDYDKAYDGGGFPVTPKGATPEKQMDVESQESLLSYDESLAGDSLHAQPSPHRTMRAGDCEKLERTLTLPAAPALAIVTAELLSHTVDTLKNLVCQPELCAKTLVEWQGEYRALLKERAAHNTQRLIFEGAREQVSILKQKVVDMQVTLAQRPVKLPPPSPAYRMHVR
jgi:hypothetical protein